MRPGLLLTVLLVALPATTYGAGPASSSSAPAVAPDPGMPIEELDRLLAPLGSGDAEARRGAAKSVS